MRVVRIRAISVATLFACGKTGTPGIDTTATESIGDSSGHEEDSGGDATEPPSFTDVTPGSGLEAVIQGQWRRPPDCIVAEYSGSHCVPDHMLGGAAVADYDADGLPDVFLARPDASDVLFRNRGDGTFEDVTTAVGLGGIRSTGGAAWGDVDGDGHLDLVTANLLGPSNSLFVQRDGVFVDETAARGAGADVPGNWRGGTSVGLGDYDLDGDLDLFYGAWTIDDPAGPPSSSAATRLLRNDGGTFVDVTAETGVDAILGEHVGTRFVFVPVFVDLDDDDLPDLLLVSDAGRTRLLWNQNGASFADGTALAGVGTDQNGMGVTVADLDLDGRLDVFVTAIFDPNACANGGTCQWGGTGNRLYRRGGPRVFFDATDLAGVRDAGWGWGTAAGDFDHDGDLDLMATNGWRRPEDIPGTRFEADPTRVWLNRTADGDPLVFDESAADVGVEDDGTGRALVTLDADADGDLDVIITRHGDTPRLYANTTDDGRGSLRVEVRGETGPSHGRGARLALRTTPTSPWQVRTIGTDGLYLGHSELVAHFGTDDAEEVDALRVCWPASRRLLRLERVGTRQAITIAESQATESVPPGSTCAAAVVE